MRKTHRFGAHLDGDHFQLAQDGIERPARLDFGSLIDDDRHDAGSQIARGPFRQFMADPEDGI
ncbi:hypothetical protein QW131_34075 [Roseibium salinum]|nr:hypothetical protein [Roseibium salinum]